MPKPSNDLIQRVATSNKAITTKIGQIHFNQAELLDFIKLKKYPKLQKLTLKFDGLCEIISNFIIINDCLGQNYPELSNEEKIKNLRIRHAHLKKRLKLTKKEIKIYKHYKQEDKNKNKLSTLLYNYRPNSEEKIHYTLRSNQIVSIKAELKGVKSQLKAKNFKLADHPPTADILELSDKPSPLSKELTLHKLQKVENSHILDISSFLQILQAYFFNIYPNSLFSNYKKAIDSTQVQNKNNHNYPVINKNELQEKLKNKEILAIGGYIKFFVFYKGFLSMQGHSMLIKKTGENKYSFFDPNEGEYYNLSFNRLYKKLNRAIPKYDATHIAFIDGQKYVQNLNPKQKGILDKKKKSRSSNRKR